MRNFTVTLSVGDKVVEKNEVSILDLKAELSSIVDELSVADILSDKSININLKLSQ